MKKRYEFEYTGAAQMVVEVDDEILTAEILKEWNEFWGDHEARADTEGGPLIPLLQMMYRVALRESIATWSALKGLREGTEEGYPKMDGSAGITIISFDDFEFDDYEINCREIESTGSTGEPTL